MFRTPWVVALALLSGLFVLLIVMDLFVGYKSLHLSTDNQNLQVRTISSFISWLMYGLAMVETSSAGWVLAMIARGKELVATILLALVVVLISRSGTCDGKLFPSSSTTTVATGLANNSRIPNCYGWNRCTAV